MEDYIKVIIGLVILVALYFLFKSNIVIAQGFEGFDGHMNDDYNVMPVAKEESESLKQ
jgi:hypothetical protein